MSKVICEYYRNGDVETKEVDSFKKTYTTVEYYKPTICVCAIDSGVVGVSILDKRDFEIYKNISKKDLLAFAKAQAERVKKGELKYYFYGDKDIPSKDENITASNHIVLPKKYKQIYTKMVERSISYFKTAK